MSFSSCSPAVATVLRGSEFSSAPTWQPWEKCLLLSADLHPCKPTESILFLAELLLQVMRCENWESSLTLKVQIVSAVLSIKRHLLKHIWANLMGIQWARKKLCHNPQDSGIYDCFWELQHNWKRFPRAIPLLWLQRAWMSYSWYAFLVPKTKKPVQILESRICVVCDTEARQGEIKHSICHI